jgi:flagellar protein FliO/FliZ
VASEGWWPGMAGIALILAICGGITAVARRFAPPPAAGAVQVVGRASLSPKHSVFLLKVGRKVLLVGAGPQGPPSLISELDDISDSPPGPHQEADT